MRKKTSLMSMVRDYKAAVYRHRVASVLAVDAEFKVAAAVRSQDLTRIVDEMQASGPVLKEERDSSCDMGVKGQLLSTLMFQMGINTIHIDDVKKVIAKIATDEADGELAAKGMK